MHDGHWQQIFRSCLYLLTTHLILGAVLLVQEVLLK